MKGDLGWEVPGEQQSGKMKCCRSLVLHVGFLLLDRCLPVVGAAAVGGDRGTAGGWQAAAFLGHRQCSGMG